MITETIREGLPPHAKRVFKGEIFEVWQWEQEMFDGTTEIFENIWRYPSVEVIAVVGDKIIIEEQDQPDRKDIISLVSGRADQSEDMLAEAKRELLEETGHQSDDWQLLWKERAEGKVLHDVHFFVARNCVQIQGQNLDAGERITTQLISFDELVALVDEPRFHGSPHLLKLLLRAQTDPIKKEELRKMLFGV
jgi:ADP-ribose pyrophosphatase